MAKVVKVRRRIKRSIVYSIYFIACFSILISLISQIFLRSYNDSLAVNVQKKEKEIVKLKKENEVMKLEIQKLISQDRIFKTAQANDMKIKQDNVFAVSE